VVFCSEIKEIDIYEKNRIFCKHGIEHVLDVARIMYLYALVNNIPIKKDIIYAAGILHDIGRGAEYKNGTPHNQAGAEKVRVILSDCGYDEKEIETIVNAISHHREKKDEIVDLDALLQYADKESRNCFHCEAIKLCNWANEDKNTELNF
jgi:putative nucleotidyltransferase with HDIG domain